MGIEMFLLKEDDTLFELGKTRMGWHVGLWELFALTTPENHFAPLPSEEELAAILKLSAEECGGWEEGTNYEKNGKYVASKIINWADGKPVRLVSDASFDDLYKKTITATCYRNNGFE